MQVEYIQDESPTVQVSNLARYMEDCDVSCRFMTRKLRDISARWS